MMIAIDIDGTLAAWPGVLAPLSRALVDAGHEVVLLTGHSCPDPSKADRAALLAGRLRQVEPFLASFREIVVCVGCNSGEVANQKGDYCRDQAVHLFIDDSRNYCDSVRKASPSTLVLEVRP